MIRRWSSVLLLMLLWAPLLRAAPPATATAPTTQLVLDDAGQPASVLQFPPDEAQVVLKLQRGGGLLFTREVKINGQEVGLFLIDTGANSSCIDRTVATRLDLPKVKLRAGGLQQPVIPVGVRSLSVGAVELRNHVVAVVDMAPVRQLGVLVEGVIGGDVFGKMPFTLDWAAPSLTLHDPAQFSPPAETQEIPIELLGTPVTSIWYARANPDAGRPAVRGMIDDLDCRLLLDSGCSVPLSVGPALTQAHPELADRRPGQTARLVAAMPQGQIYRATATRLRLFGQAHEDLRGSVAEVHEDTRSPFDPRPPEDAVVGSPVLQDYVLTFDYARRRLWVRHWPMPSMAQQLADGLNPNVRDVRDATPLMGAAKGAQLEACAALLKAGAQVNADNSTGRTVLHYALEGGDERVVRLLMDHAGRFDPAAKTMSGYTLLMCAAEGGMGTAVAWLLDRGADPNQADTKDRTALHFAAVSNSPGIIEALVKRKANVNAVDQAGDGALVFAAMGGSVEAFEALLKAGATKGAADPSMTFLHLAAAKGQVPFMRHLLDKYPARYDLEAIAKGSETPLMTAAAYGQADAIAFLLDRGAKVNASSPLHGATALHQAALKGWASVIRALLQHKADVNARMTDGITPLMAAAQGGHEYAIAALLDAGADVRTAHVSGATALHVAAGYGQHNVIPQLLKAGASLEARAQQDVRPLHLAAAAGHTDAVQALLDAGADPTAKTAAGLTLLDLARRDGHADVVDLLSKTK